MEISLPPFKWLSGTSLALPWQLLLNRRHQRTWTRLCNPSSLTKTWPMVRYLAHSFDTALRALTDTISNILQWPTAPTKHPSSSLQVAKQQSARKHNLSQNFLPGRSSLTILGFAVALCKGSQTNITRPPPHYPTNHFTVIFPQFWIKAWHWYGNFTPTF